MTDKTLKLVNWDGTNFEIYAYSGKVKTNAIVSRIGKRSW
ncbi:hypothetical protein JCM19294_43 [Nonlabens tegetincola]|uniref:Uncharacterized protein n=1 Tax=Nonlabens tegetincola TaxID=323273 RepID=A0A090Q5R4_9FLAO|nr:hypothetical protein JCM19294_43 [Nonlabens tegetincola]